MACILCLMCANSLDSLIHMKCLIKINHACYVMCGGVQAVILYVEMHD